MSVIRAALTFAVIAFLSGLLIWDGMLIVRDDQWTWSVLSSGVIVGLAAAASSFLIAFVLWAKFVGRPPRSSIRGLAAGALVGLLAHPLTFASSFPFLGKVIDNSQDGMTTVEAIMGGLNFSIMTIAFAGIVTAGIGGAIGFKLARKELRRQKEKNKR